MPITASVSSSTGQTLTIAIPNTQGFTAGLTIDVTEAKLFYRSNTHWRKFTAASPTVTESTITIPCTVLGAPIADDLILNLHLPIGFLTQGELSSPSIDVSVTNNSTRKVYDIQTVLPIRSFGGNDKKTITGINTVGGISAPRTTLVEGQPIYASASNITATGTTNPYRDLEYHWTCEIVKEGIPSPDIDDNEDWEIPISIETLVNPVNGEVWNPYTDQNGPEFSLPTDFPKQHRLTLNIRGKNNSTYTIATIRQVFTVTEFIAVSDLWYSSSGDDSNDGKDPWGFNLSGGLYNKISKELTEDENCFENYNHDIIKKDNKIFLTSATIDFTPTLMPVYWLKAEDLPSTGNLTSWLNRGAGGETTVVGTITVGSGPNNYKAVPVDSTNYISLPDFSYSEITILTFGRSDNSRALWSHSVTPDISFLFTITRAGSTASIDDDGSSPYDDSITAAAPSPAIAFGDFFMTGMTFSGTTLTVHQRYVNTSKTTSIALRNAAGHMKIGTTSAGASISEFVIFPRALTSEELSQWEGYFAWKFNNVNFLPGEHVYKTTLPYPYLSNLVDIQSKLSNSEILLDGVPDNDFTNLASSTGPKLTPITPLTGYRSRIKGGDYLNLISILDGSASEIIQNIWVHSYGSSRFKTGSLTMTMGLSDIGASGITIQDVDLDARGSTSFGDSLYGEGFGSTDPLSYSTFRNIMVRNAAPSSSGMSVQSQGIGVGAMVWNIDVDYSQSTGDGIRSACRVSGPWSSMTGITITTYADEGVYAHHCYPSKGDHQTYRLMKFLEGGNSNYCTNLDAGSSVSETPSEFKLITLCNYANTKYGTDLSSISNTRHVNGGDDNPHRNVVFELCSFHHLSDYATFYYICDSVVFRDCLFWELGKGAFFTEDTLGLIEVYRNKAYQGSTQTDFFLTINKASNTLAHQITDNVIEDYRTQPKFLSTYFTGFTTAVTNGATVFGNVMYAPNRSTDAVIYDKTSSSYKTPAQFEVAVGLPAGSLTFIDYKPFPDGSQGVFTLSGLQFTATPPPVRRVKINQNSSPIHLELTSNEDLELTITLSDDNNDGVFSENPITLNQTNREAFVTYKPTSPGNRTISFGNSTNGDNPSDFVFEVDEKNYDLINFIPDREDNVLPKINKTDKSFQIDYDRPINKVSGMKFDGNTGKFYEF